MAQRTMIRTADGQLRPPRYADLVAPNVANRQVGLAYQLKQASSVPSGQKRKP